MSYGRHDTLQSVTVCFHHYLSLPVSAINDGPLPDDRLLQMEILTYQN